MAADTLNANPTEAVVVTPDVSQVDEKELPPAPEPHPYAAEKPVEPAEEEKPKEIEKDQKISQAASFKEETYVVDELPEEQKKALDELKKLVLEAIEKHEFTSLTSEAKEEVKAEAEEKEIKVEETKNDATEVKAETTELGPAKDVVTIAEKVEVGVVDEKNVEDIKETIVEITSAATAPEDKTEVGEAAKEPKEQEEVCIWGIPLLEDERSDVVLLKFLRARDFKVKDSFEMLKNVISWRRKFGIDSLVKENLGSGLERTVFMHGVDKKGHPVCYNVFTEFWDKELYANTFGDEEKRKNFLKWRVQFFEKSIGLLDMSPSGVSTFVQVIDFKNSPGLRKEIRLPTNKTLQLLQDNYPEFVAKQVLINVSWWYLAFARIISPFLTQRTKSKIVLAGPSRTAEILFKYIAPEQVPVRFGGLSRDGEQEFTTADPATEVTIKPSTKHTVEFPLAEKCTFIWEARVIGANAVYGAEFVPDSEESYTLIVHKSKKITNADEPIITGCFKVGEQGKMVLAVDNQSSKKIKLLYRSKIKATSD